MPTDSTKPGWIEPPPPPQRRGLGCFGKGCLFLAAFGVLTILVLVLGSYLLFSGASKQTSLPVKDLPPAELADVQQRVDQFEASPSAPAEPAAPATTETGRQLVLKGEEINGLIAANRKSRGHAHVEISGNTARVRISIPSDKVPGFPRGYLNGSFTITTNGPTPISELKVSKIQANGVPVPSGVLSMTYRGQSLLGIAMDAAAPYNVSTAEIRDGTVVLH